MISTTRSTIYPKDCTFAHSDWDALAPFWYPIAFSREVNDQPIATKLLDQRLVVWRISAGILIANDICLHRGIPLSMGFVEGDNLVCKYHGFHCEPVYEFNYQVFAEDKEVVEAQYPEDLPLELRAESYIRADQTSIAYCKGLSALGLGAVYMA